MRSWGGEYHELDFTEEEADAMDNEVFEPLAVFDDDMKEVLIDVVNEKVQRILLLNPDKFQNRLPYGLRGNISDDDYIKQLREELQAIKEINGELKNENHRLKQQLDELRRARVPMNPIVEKEAVEAPPPGVQPQVRVEQVSRGHTDEEM